jgi:membrane associated rhomboid family serine protease
MGLYDRDYMRDDEPAYRRVRPANWSPTIALLVVLAAVFLGQYLVPGQSYLWMERHLGLSREGIKHGEIWQLLTFQFLHGSILHILLNGLGLYFLGRFMEQAIGGGRFLTLYFLSGTLGGVLQVLTTLLPFHLDIPVVGASAGLMGLLGAFAAMYPQRMVTVLIVVFPITLRARTLFWILTALSVAGTIYPFGGVAHAAHLGGILAGVGYVRFILNRNLARSSSFSHVEPPPVLRSRPMPDSAEDDTDFIASQVDPILDKIATQGIHSLTERERKTLETARLRMGKR